ncbi:hypothetical protein GCM10025883_38900 [Mobilicoccus caccae]|uniref:3-methyladenine DNA glycosylase AlkD n=2 Tax=Mobilicoccus caccae TaxID=1859295 RepID=A0ABQ6IV71_9MICO|nr:hypothetical protein GCM10025883_38900 [Mobilicoccus caccae]
MGTLDSMSPVAEALVRAVRQDLHRHTDHVEARRLGRRHKGDIPFLGVPRHTLVRITRDHVDDPALRLPDRQAWQAAVRGLWTGDVTRESRYAAVVLTRHPRYRALAASPLSTNLYRDLITDTPTRDTADAVAVLSLPLPLNAAPVTEGRVVRSWAVVGSPWMRRAAILCQARRFHRTDPDLLRSSIGANLLERLDIVREAIPEALTAYLRTCPEDAAADLHATLESWSSQMPAALAEAIDTRLAADERRRHPRV